MYFKLFPLLFALICFKECLGVDKTLIGGTFGADVSDTVVRRITRRGLFPDDQNFLRRLAFAESFFGEDSKTYRPGYFGGIWQLDEEFLNATKTLTIPVGIYADIKTLWDIDWQLVVWNDLLKPFYSGLAARLYIQHLVNDGKPIPGTINAQAQYWVDNYRRDGLTAVFTSRVRALETDPVCSGMLDISIVLDASGSIGPADFNKALGFVADFVSTLSNDGTKISFLIFGDLAYKRFDFNNILTPDQMDVNIRSTVYPQPNEWTNTPAGLNMAVSFFLQQNNRRSGIPQIVATFTDGNHSPESSGAFPGALNAVRNANLTSFAIGIGDAIDKAELLRTALDDRSRVYQVHDYNVLVEYVYQMNFAVCEVFQTPSLGSNYSFMLKGTERRYFKYDLPTNGLKFEVTGYGSGWYSLKEETPNSAVFDGTFLWGEAVLIAGGQEYLKSVFITVQSSSTDNEDTTQIFIYSEELPPENTGTTPTSGTTEIPTTTTMNPDFFNCDMKPSGMYPHPADCSMFIGCHNGTPEFYQCPDELLFNPVIGGCDFEQFVDCDLSCIGKPDGMHPHPHSCRLFIGCLEESLKIFVCPGELLFDPDLLVCRFPEEVDCLVK